MHEALAEHINLVPWRKFCCVLILVPLIKNVIRKYNAIKNELVVENFNSKFRFNGILVEPAESTIYEHYEINHLASYRGNPMTTGGSYSSGVTEIMNLETGQWIEGPEYPFFSRKVSTSS